MGAGDYRFTAMNSTKAMDVAGASMSNGAVIQQWTWANGNNQKWKIESVGDGYYKIIAKHSGKCVDVSGNSTENGAVIHQWDYVGGANQQWQIVRVDGGASATNGGARAIDQTTTMTTVEPVYMNLFPNPAIQSTTVTWHDPISLAQTLVIINNQGRVVFQDDIANKNSYTLNTENFDNGLYQVLIYKKDKTISEKLIIAR